MNTIEQAIAKRQPLESALTERNGGLPRWLVIGSVFTCALSLSGCEQDGGAAGENDVARPSVRTRVIERVAGELKGAKTFDEAHATIVEQFGAADRDIGSGVSIEQWDLDTGVLTLHLLHGPTFSPSGGDTVWLIETRNPLEENLLGPYDMCTKPDDSNRGTRYWLGNLDLKMDGTYAFRDSRQNLGHRDGQEHNFFMNHPEGAYEIVYPPNLTPDTLLETVETRAVVAELEFVSSDGATDQRHRIVSDPQSRCLVFWSAGDIEFEMWKGWANYWHQSDTGSRLLQRERSAGTSRNP